MSVDFTKAACQDHTNSKRFGLVDDRPKERARIDEQNGASWVAIVKNERRHEVTFTGVDWCVETLRADGKMDNRCDGILSYESTVIFVELKERDEDGNKWIKEGDNQLRTSIGYFESTPRSNHFIAKKAYIANSERPLFRESQRDRMDQFLNETGYVLRIENRIVLD